MAARTYLIGLFLILSAALRYSKRWQLKLQANMSAPTYQCLVAVINALEECLPLIEPAPPTT